MTDDERTSTGDELTITGTVDTQLHADRRIVPGRNGGRLMPFDSQRAREAARQRHAKASAAARAGLQDAAAELSKTIDGKLPEGVKLDTAYDLVRYLTAQHALNAADPSAKSAVQSFQAVTRLAFPQPTTDRSESPTFQQINSVTMEKEALDQLLEMLRLEHYRQTGEVHPSIAHLITAPAAGEFEHPSEGAA